MNRIADVSHIPVAVRTRRKERESWTIAESLKLKTPISIYQPQLPPPQFLTLPSLAVEQLSNIS